ncbi:MAG: transcriptional regulator, LysR family [Bacteroidetes bacterium]|nr:transcriptional regulator, LysR family [Bacteroidota bacterium]
MNIQQLEYIVAVDRYRHFAKAAKSCGVSQPTLSMMIQKLEDELGLEIFDRSKSPVSTNQSGEMIVNQARVVLYNIRQLREMADSTKESILGDLEMSIIPTVAPYLLPKLFGEFKRNLPSLRCRVSEMKTSTVIEKLKSAEIDLAIVATPLDDPEILEVPLYYERFLAYISPGDELYSRTELNVAEINYDRMWILEEGHCFRDQIFNICNRAHNSFQQYEAGSIETLIKVVDENGGFTIFPELHLPSLTPAQQKHVRPFRGEEPRREISLVFRQDFIKEKLLNVIVSSIKSIIPQSMLDPRLSKMRVKL